MNRSSLTDRTDHSLMGIGRRTVMLVSPKSSLNTQSPDLRKIAEGCQVQGWVYAPDQSLARSEYW